MLKKPDTFEFFLDIKFLHDHEGSNHGNRPALYHAAKWKLFTDFMDFLLGEDVDFN